MGRIVIIAILLLPFLEIAAFIWVGGQIGILATLAAIVASAVIGIAILRRQGLGMVMDSRTLLARGQVPQQEFAEMMMLAVAGFLLLVPGFITDVAGFALLVPPVRHLIYQRISRNMVIVTDYRPSQPGPHRPSIDLDPDSYR